MIPLEYICFTSHVGFAFAAKNYIAALNTLNKYDIRIVPLDLGTTGGKNPSLSCMVSKEERPDAIQIYHCIPDMFRRVARKDKAIAVAAFEGSIIPSRWIEKLVTMDRVIVPSDFNRQALCADGVTSTVVPHCLDFSQYEVRTTRGFIRPLKFMFCGTWRHRKNYELLLTAWKEEFQGTGNATLTIKTDNVKKARCTVSRINGTTNDIIFVEKILSDDELPEFFSSYDCLVTPTKGEGFGLPGLQSLAVGVPIITTNYSGVTEYAQESNSVLLAPEGFETPRSPLDGYYQFSGCIWPFISVMQLRKAMRKVYENYSVEESKVILGRPELARRFGYNEVGKQFDKVIGELT